MKSKIIKLIRKFLEIDNLDHKKIQIKRSCEDAKIPTRNQQYDAGYDLYSIESGILEPKQRKLFKTGISMSIPKGYYGRIADRSGNAYKVGTHIMAGVIDCPYRGDIGVILYNTSDITATINKHDRIAQIVIEKCCDVEFIEVSELDSTDRDGKGFGSSGV